MGLLVDGQWMQQAPVATGNDGTFKRQEQAFRHWITPDGTAGPSGSAGFNAQADRYHLTVGLACPWAHRVLIMRALKGLEAFFPLSVVHWIMGASGWNFSSGDGVVADPIHQVSNLYEIYQKADPRFTGRVTVPLVWDTTTNGIVNNESSEIIRMMNTAFDDIGAKPGDYYPESERAEIDQVNARVYDTLNNGVYKCGFATTQQAYDAAVNPLFETLDWLEGRLQKQRYLVGSALTEADIRLFTTLVRFDLVYFGHFKCNIRRLVDYPALWAYTRDIYQIPEVRQTVDFKHIRHHYYGSHESINPHRIVPAGPALNFDEPHGRA